MKQPFHFLFALSILFFAFCIMALQAFAVPETRAVMVTDVTVSSFSLVWMTDTAADPSLEVYSDSSMSQRITEGLVITPMPAGSSKVAQAAREKGIMKARVSGLQAATKYYVRTVTKSQASPDSVSYSTIYEVTTASKIALYRSVNGAAWGVANDLVAFTVYIRPSDSSPEPGLGDLIILESEQSPYPVSVFVGDGLVTPGGVLDLNNLFGPDGMSSIVSGNEKIIVKIYRAGGLSTLKHYRRISQNSGMVNVVDPLKGFFADLNLDLNVDDADFGEFKSQYRTMPDDANYNPDFNFVEDDEGKVDVRDFSKFSREYGRTDVE